MAAFTFALREAASDVATFKLLGADSAPLPIELDYPVAAGATLVEVDAFITPPPLPGVAVWPAGLWSVGISVDSADELSFAVELWRVDLNGSDIQIVAAQPAQQSGIGQITFQFQAQ